MSDIKLIDSHCHLIFENFEGDFDEVVSRWRSKGVKKLLHACCELSEIPRLRNISNKFEEIYYSVGLHPLEANKWEENSKSVLQNAALSGTYSNALNFSHSSLELSGHMFFNEYSSGRHYIHFKTAASTNQIDWRIQTNSANNTIHSWTNTLASFATSMSVSGDLTVTGNNTFGGTMTSKDIAVTS